MRNEKGAVNISGLEKHLITIGRSPDTARGYRYMLEAFVKEEKAFSNSNVSHFLYLKATEVNNRKRSPSSFNKFVKAFKAYYKFIEKDPPKDCKKRTERPKKRAPITTDEVREIFQLETKPLYNVFWMLSSHIGLRPKELRFLTVGDISETTVSINKAKTLKGDRTIWLPKSVRKSLFAYMRTLQSDLVFPSPRNKEKPISHTALKKDWEKRLAILGIEKHILPYGLRHAFGTRNARRSIPDTMHAMGHSKPEQTLYYVVENLDEQRKYFESDPLVIDKMSPEEQLRKLVMDLNESGFFDKGKFKVSFTEQSLRIAIKANI